ncbi:uncharacterized protein LOC125728388 [Brienomyrus brachyistius]|uniref:uncharacterized protein LOC125728388 n=1 Tax=Brienomyrus brachyistius TaxID=42636 RepID=UPI0020B2401B|nr:uncharacterized protein LOC125728388 [Brienomyrus brachyistius]
MPPPADGGGHWMDKLDQLTQGTKLALGDFRAVAARCLTKHSLQEIEEMAGTLTRSDGVTLTDVVLGLGEAMREMFPAPSGASMPKFSWESKTPPREYLDKCKEDWTRRTGCHPGQAGVQQEWFRRAVLEGVPEQVKVAMLANPDLPGAESPVWDRHVLHHLQRARDEATKEEGGLKDLQTQLLKLQVGEARQKAQAHKKERQGRQMVAGAPPPQFGPWVGQTPNYSNQGWGPQQWGRGRGGRGRGAGNWGWGRGMSQRWPPQGACFRCGAVGHWARECGAGQAQGGPPAGQATAPNPQAVPGGGQYPTLTGSEDWEWGDPSQ